MNEKRYLYIRECNECGFKRIHISRNCNVQKNGGKCAKKKRCYCYRKISVSNCFVTFTDGSECEVV